MENTQTHPQQGMSFAVLGVGAVGGLYGGLLANAGYEVHFLARSDFDAIQSHGLQVASPWGDFAIKPKVYRTVGHMPQVECVLVCWKSTSNHALAEVLQHFRGTQPIVVMLQNGLDVEREVQGLTKTEHILGGCCFLCSNRIGPGKIQHLDYGRIALGSYSPTLAGQITTVMSRVGQAFSRAGIPMELSTNLAEIRWKKLAWNIPYNGLSVVLDADTRQIMNDSNAAALVEELMEEVLQSARACGISIGRQHIHKMLDDTRKMVPYASSMLLDYQAGRPLEVEAIFGNPLRAAIDHGYLPIRIQMLYRQLKFIDERLSSKRKEI